MNKKGKKKETLVGVWGSLKKELELGLLNTAEYEEDSAQ